MRVVPRGRVRFQANVILRSVALFLLVLLLSSYFSGSIAGVGGDLDSSFGTGGKVTTDLGGFDEIHAVAIDSDGRVVAASTSGPYGSWSSMVVVRYSANGTLDPNFGAGGVVTIPFPGAVGGTAWGVAIQQDHKIVVVGQSTDAATYDVYGAVARLKPDGALDEQFGDAGSGTATVSFGAERYNVATAVAIQSDGRIVVAGNSIPYEGPSVFGLARFTTDGRLDTSFGLGGRVTGLFASAQSAAIQSDGHVESIVVAGSSWDPDYTSSSFCLARYSSSGTLDTSFGSAGTGLVTTDFPGATIASPRALAIQRDGKIVVAGNSWNPYPSNYSRFSIARYTSNGTLDTNFGNAGTGLVITQFGVGSSDTANGVAIDRHDRIVVGGYSYPGTGALDWDFGVIRYSPGGALDTTFGSAGTGKVTTDFAQGSADWAVAMALQSDDRIVLAGTSFSDPHGNDRNFAIARYLASPYCVTNADCDNGNPCDGHETCDLITGNCLPGVPPQIDGVSVKADTTCVSSETEWCAAVGNIVFADGLEYLGLSVAVLPPQSLAVHLSSSFGSIEDVETDATGAAFSFHTSGVLSPGDTHTKPAVFGAVACGAEFPRSGRVLDYAGFDFRQQVVDDAHFVKSDAMNAGSIQTFFKTPCLNCDPSFLAKFRVLDVTVIAPGNPPQRSTASGYYDANDNGAFDAGEPVYLPGTLSKAPPVGTKGEAASAVVADVATRRGIHPGVLLATMQKEESLITGWSSSLPPKTTLNLAMGCDKSTNFSAQLECGAKTLVAHFKDTMVPRANTRRLTYPFFFQSRCSANPMGVCIRHAVSDECDVDTPGPGCEVVAFSVRNAATYTQYLYTPYIQAKRAGGGVYLFDYLFTFFGF